MATKTHCDNCDVVTTSRAGQRITIQPDGYNVTAYEPQLFKRDNTANEVRQVVCTKCMRVVLTEMADRLSQIEA